MPGKAVLITGAAHGLGNALARRFADAGWHVVASMLDTADAAEFDGDPRITKIVLDIADVASIERGVAEAIGLTGGIDLLINNAAFGSFAVVEATPEALIRKFYDTNALGPVFVTRAMLPHMRERKQGTILFVTSGIAGLSAPMHAMYGACKWAQDGFAEALVYETAAFGVRIKIALPGSMSSSFFKHTEDAIDDLPEEYRAAVRQMREGMTAVMAEAATPEDAAAEVYAAATDDSDRLRYYVTEQARRMIDYRREIGDEEWLRRAVASFSTGRSVVEA